LARVAEAAICPIFSRVQEYSSTLAQAGLTVLVTRDLTNLVMKTWEVVCSRVQKLRLLAHLTPSSVREFSEKIGLIHEAFRKRLLTYQLWVVASDQGTRSQTPSRFPAARAAAADSVALSSGEFSSCQSYYFRMQTIYVVDIISGSSTIRLGDARLISYKATKLVLRWSAKTSAQLSLIRDHATLQTILTFRLASEGAVFWVSPPFPSAGHICRRKESPVRIDSPRQGGSVLV